MSSLLSNIKTLWALTLFFNSHCVFKNKTPCQISDFHTECYMGGGGSDLQYGLRQADHFMQLKIGRN